jgi:hypothetical protein
MVGRLKTILDRDRDRRPGSRHASLAIGFGFCIMGMCLAATPETAKSPGMDPRNPDSAVTPTDPAKPIVLKGGSNFRLIYIESGRSSGGKTWKADGTVPGDRIPGGNSYSYSAAEPKDGKRTVSICCQLGDIPRAEQFRIDTVRIPHPLKLGGLKETGLGWGGGGQNLVYNAQYVVPEDWKSADIEFETGMGEFHEIAENGKMKRDIQLSLSAQLNPGHVSAGSGSPARDIQMRWSDVSLVLPPKAKDKEWRLAAFDRDNKPLRIGVIHETWASQVEAPNTWHATVMADPDEITRITISVRNSQRVKIRGVHLYPQDAPSH